MDLARPTIKQIKKTLHYSTLRPWPNDSIFHSILSSTLHLKVERSRTSLAKRLDFSLDFLSTFQLVIFPQRISAKMFAITNICPPNEMLLRTLSLDILDKVAKRVDFHSTTILSLDFFDKDQTSLNHSTPLDSLNKVANRLYFSLDILSSKQTSERSSRLARA